MLSLSRAYVCWLHNPGHNYTNLELFFPDRVQLARKTPLLLKRLQKEDLEGHLKVLENFLRRDPVSDNSHQVYAEDTGGVSAGYSEDTHGLSDIWRVGGVSTSNSGSLHVAKPLKPGCQQQPGDTRSYNSGPDSELENRLYGCVEKALEYIRTTTIDWGRLIHVEGHLPQLEGFERLDDTNHKDIVDLVDELKKRAQKEAHAGALYFSEQTRRDIRLNLDESIVRAFKPLVADVQPRGLLTEVLETSKSISMLQECFKSTIEIWEVFLEDLPAFYPEEDQAQGPAVIWNHITISMDHTSSGNFKQELLSILGSSAYRKADAIVDEEVKPKFRWHAKAKISTVSEPVAQFRRSYPFTSTQTTRKEKPPSKSPSLPASLAMPAGISVNLEDRESLLPSRKLLSPDQSNHGSELESASRNQLLDRISALESENKNLKDATEINIGCEIIYFIVEKGSGNMEGSRAYQDEPTWAVGARGEIVLKSHFPIPNVDAYIEQKQDLAFLIGRFYSPDEQQSDVRKAVRERKTPSPPKSSEETIRLVSTDMEDAMEAFLATILDFERETDEFDPSTALPAPYLFWYHHRSSADLRVLSQLQALHMRKLTEWIEHNYGEMYKYVEEQLSRGVVSSESMVFLLKRGDTVVVDSKLGHKDGTLKGAIAEDYPSCASLKTGVDDTEILWSKRSKCGKTKRTWRWDIEVELTTEKSNEEVVISTLNAYPLKYANEKTKIMLECRGKVFWSCRNQRLVSYEDKRGIYGAAERFMVDFRTYKQLHSDTFAFKREYQSIDDSELTRMDPAVLESDEPPSSPEIYVFPDKIPAYNLRSKKWVDLEIDMIREVSWNKLSFSHLVIDDESKDLVQALVTNQIAREQGTDIIESKGNGLIILLNGGPGTGKTFTAERVAEMAEKPLFRVTCGDIGTKPEAVEKYLESVLHLSKIWGCVVLLDEADVFLEQRTLSDLERNALVSVFLRVLEYYEGILILTSNGVGTFDEAFKSRIQLSLHYENLDRGQRKKIWRNFLSRLQEMDESIPTVPMEPNVRSSKDIQPIAIDYKDIDGYIGDLANIDMNGRQIRNAITTARQLARFKNETMKYRHLKHVIKVSNKFDKYLLEVHEGMPDDVLARGEGIR
ncbi:hypothetical protein OPT61_g5071 [Boeremia exigua]|uniref:Uncharacterized protein n=1 Tax=Boeremia exigua TaxID=749465 RepID=A0ACC2IBM3_9PLEO|nr:hypothetical protein OPT61_g5071 [Boeremia exigua]